VNEHLHTQANRDPIGALIRWLGAAQVQVPHFLQSALASYVERKPYSAPAIEATVDVDGTLAEQLALLADERDRLATANAELAGVVAQGLEHAIELEALRVRVDALQHAVDNAIARSQALGGKSDARVVPGSIWDALVEAANPPTEE